MRKITYALWIFIFLLLIALPVPVQRLLYPVDRNGGNIENAETIEKPVLSADDFSSFPSRYEAWFNQNLPFRSRMITANALIDYRLFRKTDSDEVVIGENGWLFYAPSLPAYQNAPLYAEDELAQICDHLEEIRQYVTAQGADFILMIAPSKVVVYGDQYLPQYLRRAEDATRVTQLAEALQARTNVSVVYPAEILAAVAKTRPRPYLYYHLDTHWTMCGAYLASQALGERVGFSLPDLDALTVTESDVSYFNCAGWNGRDLVNLMGLTQEITQDTGYTISGYDTHDVVFENDIFGDRDAYFGVVRATSTDGGGKVMFVRDSFGTAMAPFIASNCAAFCSPHVSCMTPELIAQEQPDIVILELVDRVDWKELNLSNWNP